LVVILAEKPSQAKAYAEALKNSKRHEGYFDIPSCSLFPNGAKITWGIGHLVTLKEPHEYQEEWGKWNIENLPIVPEAFQFKVVKDTKKQFDIVKGLLKETDEIVVATDCDREGENIARSIIYLSGAMKKPTKRLWINSLEEGEVIRGFQNLRNGNDYLSLYEEAQARQISDWLVGLNASRLYTLLLQKKGVKEPFSVGRVQTPTLKLIHERQKEIENFKPEPFFELEAIFNHDNTKFKGRYKERFKTIDILKQELQKHGIAAIPTNIVGNIKNVQKNTKKINPPKLHSLSSLQTLANKKYKYSPSKVLQIVQSLYDTPLKLLTYPRTDTEFITENEFAYLKDNLTNYQNIAGQTFEPLTLEPQKSYVDNSKVQEHYAIIPTKKIPNKSIIDGLTEEQKNIYMEIVKSILGMFHHPYIYEETVIETDVQGLLFLSTGKVEKSVGWKKMFSLEEKEDEKEENQKLPEVNVGLKCEGLLKSKEGKTSSPKRYTEGQLINLMKTCGKIIDESENEIKAILKEIDGLGTEATRSGIIETLKRQNYIEVKKNLVYVTKKGEILCTVVDGTLLSKPELTAKWESYLKKIGQNQGNKNTFINSTIEFTKTIVDNAKTDIEQSNIDTNIQEINSAEHIGLCPSCKKGHIVDKNSFYGCTEYKNGCKQTFQKKLLEKSLTKTNIKQICEKGKTSKIKGFKGKKEFDACLILKDGKLSFSFE
jgi:DNA topoisomerase III